jgi:hypothetical protein
MVTPSMSSTNGLTRSVLFLFVLIGGASFPAFSQQSKSAAAIVCPANITVNESAEPIPGWTITPTKTRHAFERISVYNGRSGGQEYDLAPDDEKRQRNRITQTWMLKGYRSMNIFLRCLYRGTSAVLTMDLPPRVETCALRFTIDSKGQIVGESEMDCR